MNEPEYFEQFTGEDNKRKEYSLTIEERYRLELSMKQRLNQIYWLAGIPLDKDFDKIFPKREDQ